MNKSEEMVYNLCRRSFLSLWSYANPLRKDGKELCDILVICEPDVIIFSVKEIGFKEKGDPSTEWPRWLRKAVDESVRQIYGAEREISMCSHVIRQDGEKGLPFPDRTNRRIHRIAVALGSKGEVPIFSGDMGNGYIHVLTEESATILLRELDTITDFVNYLTEKEEFALNQKGQIISSGEKDVLAVYLTNKRKFPSSTDIIMIDDGCWEKLCSRPEFIARKEEDRYSYAWDYIIHELSEHLDYDVGGPNATLCEKELAVRTMAQENRFNRRISGNNFIELLTMRRCICRCFVSPSNVVYVFLFADRNISREDRRIELAGRCFIARGLHQDSSTVIGIATEVYDPSGYSYDACYVHILKWTSEDQENMEYARENFGWFKKTTQLELTIDEFPTKK